VSVRTAHLPISASPADIAATDCAATPLHLHIQRTTAPATTPTTAAGRSTHKPPCPIFGGAREKEGAAHSNATMSPPPTTNTGYPPLHQHQHQHQHHASATDTPILDPSIPASHSTQTPTAPAPSPASVTPHTGSPSHPRHHHHRGPPPPFDPRSAHSKKEEELRRNLQARGKNYNLSNSSSSGAGAGKSGGTQASRAWGYEERQRRDEAAGILESEEMIMWIAGVRNEVRYCFSFFPISPYIIRDQTSFFFQAFWD